MTEAIDTQSDPEAVQGFQTQLPDAPMDWEWVILHTRPRAEKKVLQHYEQEGRPMYLPLRKKEHRYGGRLRAFWSPLFGGYAFGCFPCNEIHKIKYNQYVANVLRVLDQGPFLQQLRAIEKALAFNEMVDVMPYLEQGKPVRIVSGPMKGVEGIVERIAQKTKVVISIEMIQQSVFVEVDSSMIEPLP